VRKERLLGTVLTLPLPEIAEMAANAGFDWLFLDMEHGLLDFADAQRLAQAAGRHCACLARLPSSSAVWVKKALDLGLAGIIVPMINTPEEAARVVLNAKYPPQGRRSVGVGRSHRYGANFRVYVDNANENTTIIVQIEHIQAVENIDAILDVPGIDGVLVGPFDLSASMGKPGYTEDPEVQAAIQRVLLACQKHSRPAGIFMADAAGAALALGQGFTLIACSSDTLQLTTAYSGLFGQLKASAISPPKEQS
jgi:2-dehydro-3-deoxyglucarate aldolase/4-hydroxy-2-oxoheptanedioate aldolase